MTAIYISTAAAISADGVYRYSLGRVWSLGGRIAAFIMLNPSTADADLDDPTIRRCTGFAMREGCDGLIVVNLYAYRATKPEEMFSALDAGVDIVGPDNDVHIANAITLANSTEAPIIAAWGAHGRPHRVYAVKSMPGMEKAAALAFTKAGAPGHPLYIKADAPLIPLTKGGRIG